VISWSVAENESGNYFQIEKSLDGKNFIATGITFNTTKTGNESYSYKEAKNNYSYYRLKVFNKDQSVAYSKIILIKNDSDKTSQSLRLLQNPVQSSLNFSYQSFSNDIGVISIYTISGTRLSTTKSLIHQGANSFSIELNNKLTNGMYVLEITSGNQRSTTKFLKQ
jgi:hypothetical protein